MASETIDIPLIIGGEEIRTGDTLDVVMPHDHGHVLAKAHKAGPDEVKKAIAAAMEAHHDWSTMRWEDRAAIFLKAAELLAGPWRQTLNASTMLGQSKTSHQAEIDAACEMIDFFRFNVHFAEKIYAEQPLSDRGMWNRSEYRSLEGFVYAITPFNFTSIGGNLPSSPAIMGNTVVWKPARTSLLSNYYMAKLFEAAGLPAGRHQLHHRQLREDHRGGPRRPRLRRHPLHRLHRRCSTPSGATSAPTSATTSPTRASSARPGGKDFIVAHPSADPEALLTAIVRGAFEYQGQKCSAASRAYVPESVWKRDPRAAGGETDEHPDGRRARTSRTSWARSSTSPPSTRSRATSTGPGELRTPRSSPAASATTPRATSSGPR